MLHHEYALIPLVSPTQPQHFTFLLKIQEKQEKQN